MQLTYLKTALPHAECISKITALSWSANSQKFAAVSADKVVHVFDESGERKDKFKTKAADPSSSQNYVVRSMAFSPDSTKLALAQSDNIVFVYRLGLEWGEKKSICNKFQQSASITAMVWPNGRDQELIFATADGKVKLGVLKTNKPLTLYDHPDISYTTCMAARRDGNAVLSGHADGSLHVFNFDDGTPAGTAKFAQHSCPPAAMSWGAQAALVTGNDWKVTLYDRMGSMLQQLDFSGAADARDFTCAAFNPGGDVAVLGGFNCLTTCSFNAQAGIWEMSNTKKIENLYSVTAVGWKADGSRLAVGNLCGGVDLFDACLRRHRYKGAFEFTYVSKSQVIVKRLATSARIVLKSRYEHEVERINVYQDRFLVANTAETLMLGDMDTCCLSEVSWETTGTEKYHFDNPQVCLLYNAGEVSLIEYGQNEILGTCRTEHMSPYLISVRINPPRGNLAEEKKMAYLVDKQTAKVTDLQAGVVLATVSHGAKIDWLELNARATHLLFRDKRRHLHLYNIAKQERTTLLPYCSYVQWVPGSDVVVAQSRGSLCVWYSINAPDQQTVLPIKGDVENIERTRGKTEVLVEEARNTVSYLLDENLIDFGSALEEQDYDRAVDTLEPLEMTPETEAQWQQLAKAALHAGKLAIAERCYAAVGNVAKAQYLRQVGEVSAAAGEGADYLAQAKLAQLSKQWGVAEAVLLAQGRTEEAIQMYIQAYRWEDAIKVASRSNASEAQALKRRHFQWLLESGQDEQAARVKERDGDFVGAITLFLQGGLPAKAAQAVLAHPNNNYDSNLLESIITACSQAGLFDKSGNLYEHQQRWTDAKAAYKRGHVYRKALDLVRRHFPAEVVALEEEWGDWLMSQHQVDAAINHFIEAGCSLKAVEAALAARQWQKAAAVLDSQDQKTAAPFYCRIAKHFEQAQSLEEAERFYIKAGLARQALEMYAGAGKWAAAHKVAMGYLPEQEVKDVYTLKARELEAGGRLRDAEKLYCSIKAYDSAITMYKQHNMWEHVIRLVAQHRKGQLAESHVEVAKLLQAEGSFKEAEKHFVEAGDWKGAVQMYRAAGMWEGSFRLAKAHGGALATKQVAFAWAVSIEPEEGTQLLLKLGLLDPALDYALESGAFAQAFQLCQAPAAQHKMSDCHLKYAMHLEDEGRFGEAEEEFVRAGKPKEAIDMYCHQQDWAAALSVANTCDPASVPGICALQGEAAVQAGNWPEAEGFFLRAKQPEAALAMYRKARMWSEALRIAEDYLPDRVAEVHNDIQNNAGSSKQSPEGQLARAKALERGRDWSGAIDAYLAITTQDTTDLDFLEGVWESAVNIAMNNRKERISQVVTTVAQRLVQGSRHEAAAELLQGIDDIQGAVRVYVLGDQYDKARLLARTDPALQQYVEQQHTHYLLRDKNAEGLANIGNATEAIEIYAQQGDWERVHALAEQAGPQSVIKYSIRHAKQKAQQGEVAEAAAVLSQYGAAADPAHFDLYKHVVGGVLALPRSDQSKQGERDCKDFLWQLVQPAVGAGGSQLPVQELVSWWEAAHYTVLQRRCAEAGMQDLAAKQATSLLRYIGAIPADKAFYEAGYANQEAGRLDMAFVFLNRYLDLTEAMDEPDAGPLENADFVDTDIPFDFHIPDTHYITETLREEVRDQVLAMSMDQSVSQELTHRSCSQCGASIYDASLTCHSCQTKSEACCVSGYPIPSDDRAQPPGCPLPARRLDWNEYVSRFQTCPVTDSVQSPLY